MWFNRGASPVVAPRSASACCAGVGTQLQCGSRYQGWKIRFGRGATPVMAPRLASTMGTTGVPRRCWHPAWLTCAAPVSARSARMSKTMGGRYDWGATPVLAPCLAAACRAGDGTRLHVLDNYGRRFGATGVPRRC